MTPQVNLVDYIQEQTQQGISAQALRESLLESGWPERDINNALHDVAAGLHPATPGASIHEDLAQVRGLVAHLAARIGRIEAALPSNFIGPDHELTAEPHSRRIFFVLAAALALAVAGYLLGQWLAQF